MFSFFSVNILDVCADYTVCVCWLHCVCAGYTVGTTF